jgi:hypothetical protein
MPSAAAASGRAVVVAVLLALGGCTSKGGQVGDASVETPSSDARMDLSGLLPAPSCGGTATVIGSTPAGPFHGDLVTVRAFYGAETGLAIYVADDVAGTAIYETISWLAPGSGPALPAMQFPVTAFFVSNDPSGASATVAGTVDVTAAANPGVVADGGVAGSVEAMLTYSQTGFDLSGSISSPYCVVFPYTGPSP